MNYKDYVKEKIKRFTRKDIIITKHAKKRAKFRQIDINEVIENILNPKRLNYAEKQEESTEQEEIFGCYFYYSKTQSHKYVIKFTENLIVITVIKIRLRWQRIAEKKARKKVGRNVKKL